MPKGNYGNTNGFKKGTIPWNKGKQNPNRKYNIPCKICGKDSTSGRCQKCFLSTISSKLTGRKLSKETKDKISKYQKSIQKGRKIRKKDTLIEIKIRNFLDILKIPYMAHKYIEIPHGYQCDTFIEPNIVIECDGDFWHANPKIYKNNNLKDYQKKQRIKDKIRNKEMKTRGYKVLRMWQNEINNMDIINFRRKLYEFLS